MRFFKKLTCLCFGHKPFVCHSPDTDIQKIYDEYMEAQKEVFPTNIINNVKLNQILNSWSNTVRRNSSYTNDLTLNNGNINYSLGPFNYKMNVCARCGDIYYYNGINENFVCNEYNLPELKNLRSLARIHAWEKHMISKYPDIEKSYKSYKMLLTLKLKGKSNEYSANQ